MKIRMIALAGVAALALTGPAAASDATGWYLGVAAGYDHMGNIKVRDIEETTPPTETDDIIGTKDGGLFTGTFGYKFHDHIRFEGEIGWSSHSIDTTTIYPFTYAGHTNTLSSLANVFYDYPLSEKWTLSIGAGGGIGRNWTDISDGSIALADGSRDGFMWQGDVGMAYSLTHNLDITVDWRYRSLSVNKDYPTSFEYCTNLCVLDSVKVTELNDQAVLVGLRWYLESAPPPPPPPPPPVVAPPPVKTFIVFFDFNKSNLTAEALSVVQEAVKVAKANGFVKVMVTGHTDTVGSDSYNQGLSVRRAEAVKDEMTREGMDGSTISIEGKSFHDPLVPTGPGVREPQNRRAVIDLGG